MKGFILSIATFCCILPIISPLHSGGTDGSGGHYDHSTGEYHYHHGYPAHQHPNGECPYDEEDFDCGREDCDIQGQHGHINKPKTTTTTTTSRTQKQENDSVSKDSSDNDKGFIEWPIKILIGVGIIFAPAIIGFCFEKCKTIISKLKKR